MADIVGVNDTLPVRIGGVSTSSGLPDNYVEVKSASTAALSTDTSMVVALSPNSAVPSGSNTIGSLNNISGTISLPTGAATSALQTTGNTTLSSILSTLTLAQGSTTSGQTGNLSLAAVTTASPTYSNGQTSPLSLTTAGALRIDGSATTQPVSGTVAVTQSTSPWVVKDQADGTVGSTAPTIAGLVGGTDGTNLRALKTDTSGNLLTDISDGTGLPLGSMNRSTGVLSNNNFLAAGVIQFISTSNVNSTNTNLASGATFTGTGDPSISQAIFEITFFADQNCTIQCQQSKNDVNWDVVDTYTTTANVGDARTFICSDSFVRVLVTNNGGSTTTAFRLNSQFVPIGNPMPRALSAAGNLKVAVQETLPGEGADGATAPSLTMQVGGKDGSGNLQAILTDTSGNQAVLLKDASGNSTSAINNQLETRDVINVSAQFRAQSVTTSAAEAIGAASRLTNRKVITITPTNGTIYWGTTTGVTTTTGTPIFANQTLTLAFTDNVPVYVIAGATIDVRIVEAS